MVFPSTLMCMNSKFHHLKSGNFSDILTKKNGQKISSNSSKFHDFRPVARYSVIMYRRKKDLLVYLQNFMRKLIRPDLSQKKIEKMSKFENFKKYHPYFTGPTYS